MTPSRQREARWPWVLLVFSLLCLFMKAGYSLLEPPIAEGWLHFWGFIPTEVMQILATSPENWINLHVLNLVTAQFIHADWLHLVGNLAYLWVFGVTVERAIGHWRFAMCFLLLGALANLYVAWQASTATVPVIGASGGVSVIIGIYIGLFPNRRMGLWLPLGLFLQFARVPAMVVIGSWFILQLLFSLFGPMSGEIAWWSHIAGFVGGLLAALALRLYPAGINLALRED